MSKKGKPLPSYHPTRYFDACPVCRHPQRDLLEGAYIRWKPMTQLANVFDIPLDEIRRHFEALNFKRKRLDNRRDLIAGLVEQKFETGEIADLPWSEVIKLLKHEDVVEGLVVHRVQTERPRILIQAARPSPSGELADPDQPLLLEATFEEEDGTEETPDQDNA